MHHRSTAVMLFLRLSCVSSSVCDEGAVAVRSLRVYVVRVVQVRAYVCESLRAN